MFHLQIRAAPVSDFLLLLLNLSLSFAEYGGACHSVNLWVVSQLASLCSKSQPEFLTSSPVCLGESLTLELQNSSQQPYLLRVHAPLCAHACYCDLAAVCSGVANSLRENICEVHTSSRPLLAVPRTL